MSLFCAHVASLLHSGQEDLERIIKGSHREYEDSLVVRRSIVNICHSVMVEEISVWTTLPSDLALFQHNVCYLIYRYIVANFEFISLARSA